MPRKNTSVKISSLLAEENEYQVQRRREMTSTEERFKEFARIQERARGKNWTKIPIERVVSFKKLFCSLLANG